MTKHWVLISLSLLLLVSISAGGAQAQYKFGNITTTTGPYSSQGVSNTEGITMLMEKINQAGGINGEKVVILTEDHEGEASKALTLAKKMVYEDKVIGIIGATNTAGSMAVSRICNEAKIPQIQLAPKPSTEPVKRYTFQDVPDNDVDAEAIAQFAVTDLKLKKLAILYDTNAYGTSGAESQEKILKKMGVQVVAIEKYKQEDRDMTASLLKIKNQGADGLIGLGHRQCPLDYSQGHEEARHENTVHRKYRRAQCEIHRTGRRRGERLLYDRRAQFRRAPAGRKRSFCDDQSQIQ